MIVATLPYEEMLRRHPKEVAEIVSKLRKGKSKVRDADPATITWTYEACVLIEGSGSFADLLSGKMERAERKWNAMTLDEKVADTVRRTSTGICARLGRWWGGSDAIPNPPEVAENTRAGLMAQAAEQARADALTPEERRRETEDLLRQLGADPGFAAILLEEP
jgi:hypothetical protein